MAGLVQEFKLLSSIVQTLLPSTAASDALQNYRKITLGEKNVQNKTSINQMLFIDSCVQQYHTGET